MCVGFSVPGAVDAGTTFPVSFTYENTGNTDFNEGAVCLVLIAGEQYFVPAVLSTPLRVRPGERVTISGLLMSPSVSGSYPLQMQLFSASRGPISGAVSPSVLVTVAEKAAVNVESKQLHEDVVAVVAAIEALQAIVESAAAAQASAVEEQEFLLTALVLALAFVWGAATWFLIVYSVSQRSYW